MAAIRSRNTAPELMLRSMLFRAGYRYRVAPSNIPGRPDLFLRKYNAAVFVHGCFWHRHDGCPAAAVPKSNVDFWRAKFEANARRDRAVTEKLAAEGIRQLVVWECTLKEAARTPEKQNALLEKIETFLNGQEPFAEF